MTKPVMLDTPKVKADERENAVAEGVGGLLLESTGPIEVGSVDEGVFGVAADFTPILGPVA